MFATSFAFLTVPFNLGCIKLYFPFESSNGELLGVQGKGLSSLAS